MLFWADDNSEVLYVPVSRKKFYEAGLNRLAKSEERDLKDYINQILDDAIASSKKEVTFLVPGWEAGAEWEDELNVIWEKVFRHDKESCGKWYGLYVMDTIIHRKDKWYAHKTNFNRPFDQTVYWIKDR